MDVPALDDFCNSTFWDSNLTWHTDSPRFTPCFQKTILVWIPCLFLWMFSCIDANYSFSSKTRNIPWNWRNLSKLAAVGLLVILCIFDFFYNWFAKVDVGWADVISPLIKIVTLVLCAILMILHVKYGQRASGVLFLFWLLIILLGVPQLVWDIEARINGTEEPTQVSYFIFYILSWIVFILYFFADLAPEQSEYPSAEKPIPEESASFPSQLTFAWFDAFILLGFKKTLVSDDLWPLSFSESAAAIFPIFNKHWTKSVKNNSKIHETNSAKFNKEGGVNFSGKHSTKRTSIVPALCKSFGQTFLLGAFLKLIGDLLSFVSPQILKLLIDYVTSNEPLWLGFFYSGTFLIVGALQTFLVAHHNYICSLVGLRIKTALTASIYRKVSSCDTFLLLTLLTNEGYYFVSW